MNNAIGIIGIIVSTLGVFLTVWYARKASIDALSAKKAALQASANTKRLLFSNNAIGDLQKLNDIFSETKQKIDTEELEFLANQCAEAHVITSKLKAQSEGFLSKDEALLVKYINTRLSTLETRYRDNKQKLKNSKSKIHEDFSDLLGKTVELSTKIRSK